MVTIDDVKKHLTPEECAALDAALTEDERGYRDDSLSSWLGTSFAWKCTEQGYDYWKLIFIRLVALENGEQPPADTSAQDDRLADGEPVFGDDRVIGFVKPLDYVAAPVADDQQLAGYTTKRQHAAIALRVPNSGSQWLDDMIREARRLDAAQAAMAARFGVINLSGTDYSQSTVMANVAKQANVMADKLVPRGGAE